MDLNLTLEEDPFSALDEEDSFDPEVQPFDVWGFITRSLELGVCGISTMACLLLIYSICKNKPLQTRTNSYLVHYAIASVAFMCFTPLYQFLLEFWVGHWVDHRVVCVVYRMDGVSSMMSLTFAMMLALDFMAVVFFRKQWMEVYERFQRSFVLVIYCLAAADFLTFILHCFGSVLVFPNITLLFIYLVYLVLNVGINLAVCCKKPDAEQLRLKYSLVISTYVLFSWLPLLLFYAGMVFLFVYRGVSFEIMVYILDYFLKFILYSGPVVVVVYLGRVCPEFHRAFLVLFRQDKHSELDEDMDDILLESEAV